MSATLNVDELPQADDEATWKKPLILGVVLLVLGGLGYWGVSSMSHQSAGPKKQTVKIALLPDTPPPPPPPKVEKRVEPDKKEQAPQPDVPKPQVAPPEPQQLKMDGPAGDGPSAFASGSVNSEYKGGEIGSGIGGGTTNRMQFALFSGQLQRHIQAALAKDQRIKLGDYRLNVQVWLSPGGDFQKIELLSSSGDAQTDERLQAAFKQMPPMRDVPADLPQPIRLRITNRMTG